MTDPKIDVPVRSRPSGHPRRILLTNDDGIDARGLHAIARALVDSYDLLIVAPDGERSGSGTGIGQFDPSKGVETTTRPLGGIDGYAIAGPPGLAVMATMLGAFGEPPDLVVSGINAGINTGHSVVHSGTVGAILTARTFGANGLAVSLEPSEPWHFDTASRLGAACVAWISQHDQPYTLNLNVPALPLDELKGIRWADLDAFGYFRVAIGDVPGESIQFEVGPPDGGLDPGSDSALLRDGYATLTPLSTVEPSPFPELSPPEIGDL